MYIYIYICICIYIFTFVCICVCMYICIYIHVNMHAYTHIHTGWQRRKECLKLQVSFRKRALQLAALLRKETWMYSHIHTGWRRSRGLLCIRSLSAKESLIPELLGREGSSSCPPKSSRINDSFAEEMH